FHDDEQPLAPFDLALSRVEQAHEMRMRERSGRLPMPELCFGERRIGRDELDGRVEETFGRGFGEEDRAVVGGTQKTSQRIQAIDLLPPPSTPRLSHRHSPPPPAQTHPARAKISLPGYCRSSCTVRCANRAPNRSLRHPRMR